MVTIIGVKFQCAGKLYYFDPEDKDIQRGMSVIVETARGQEMGTVVIGRREVEESGVVFPLKPVIRVATTEDFDVIRDHKIREKEAFRICKEKIMEHGLEMKLVNVEYTFDSNKILFYFTADGRVDFRDLVKDLASVFRTRIELRQIGVRDETKMCGGIGICGRELCCHSYMHDFIPVSIKMAKEQNLSLNPSKISGVCGRLMCCLKNEEDTYEYLNDKLPKVGARAMVTETGEKGQVQSVNVLRQTVRILVEEGDTVEAKDFPVESLRFRPRHRKGSQVEEDQEDWSFLDPDPKPDDDKKEKESGRYSSPVRTRKAYRTEKAGEDSGHSAEEANASAMEGMTGEEARKGRVSERENRQSRREYSRERNPRQGRENAFSRDRRGRQGREDSRNEKRNGPADSEAARMGAQGPESGERPARRDRNGHGNRPERRNIPRARRGGETEGIPGGGENNPNRRSRGTRSRGEHARSGRNFEKRAAGSQDGGNSRNENKE